MVQVACGASHVLALSADGELFAWGRGDGGKPAAQRQPLRSLSLLSLSCSVPSQTCLPLLGPFFPSFFSPLEFYSFIGRTIISYFISAQSDKMSEVLPHRVSLSFQCQELDFTHCKYNVSQSPLPLVHPARY